MKYPLIVLALAVLLFAGCEKEPGEGGLASISGKIYVQDYNGNCTELRDEYYGIDEEVYIIAGDDPSYFERVRTGPDGTYWFPYLRKGDYTVYSLSENCEAPGDLEAVEQNVSITRRKQEKVLTDIVVIR
ncbi:MAG TPA: hypothetical protein VJ911_02545 [Cryomorphaceae bacterium]|nr:hypothetical protein [Cryomorphaceae bacterium]